jgi:DNA sulfur modification protein DndE
MKPPVETVRISKQGRDQLMKVRRQTGIENWNILCRWALCLSLREETPPPAVKQKLDGGVEMAWKVFSGEESEVLSALVLLRSAVDGFEADGEGPSNCLKAHIHRGLSYMASGQETRSITDFTERWVLEAAG